MRHVNPNASLLTRPGAAAATPRDAESSAVQTGMAGSRPDKVAAAGDDNPGPATPPEDTAAAASPLEEHLATLADLPHHPAPHHATPRYDLHLPRPGDPPVFLAA